MPGTHARTNERVSRLAAMLPFALVAAVVFAASRYTFLQTDDFCTYGRVLLRFGGNPLLDVHNLYMHWTGRYSASLVVAAVAASAAFVPVAAGYALAMAALLLLFGYACLAASRLPSPRGEANPALALAMFGATLVLMPSKLEQYLWLTGAAVYFVGASLLVVYLQASSREDAGEAETPLRIAARCLLVALIVGFNEFLAVALGACLSWQALARWRAGRGLNRSHWTLAAVYALALATTLLAPGNFARDAAIALPRHDAFFATAQALADAKSFLAAMARSSGALAASLVAACLAGALKPAAASPARDRVGRLAYPAILVAAFPMHLWVYAFLTGSPTPGRIVNQAFMLASLGLFLLLATCGQSIAARLRHVRWLPAATLAGFALAGAGLATSHDFRALAGTVRTYAPALQAQRIERHEGLAGLRGSTLPVYARPFVRGDAAPPIFQGTDIGDDPEDWINRCVADFYEVPSIQLMRRLPDPERH